MFHKAVVLTALLSVCTLAVASDPIEKALSAKNFYTSGFGSNLSAGEIGSITTLAHNAQDPVLRLRAQHIHVELEHSARIVSDLNRELIVVGLQYLEAQKEKKSVQRLLDAVFNHYMISKNNEGETYFLIESISHRDENGKLVAHPGGGLNLKIDPKTKTVLSMASWGAISVKEEK